MKCYQIQIFSFQKHLRRVQDSVKVDCDAKPELDVMRKETIVITAGQSEVGLENKLFQVHSETDNVGIW